EKGKYGRVDKPRGRYMYDAVALKRDESEMLKHRLSRWVTKERSDEVLAQILIPRTDIRGPMFEHDFTWLMFTRYNIDTYKLIYKRLLKGLRDGLDEMVPFLIDDDGTGKALKSGRMVSFVYYEMTVLVRIHGRKPKDGIQGRLSDLRFNHSRVPGKLNADGSINWYELEKFMVVAQGDVLGTLAEPVEGECGVSIFNESIPAKPPEPLDIRFGDGIVITRQASFEENPEFKQISAKVDGVLIYEHTERGVLCAIDVVREIRTKSICFETGNLGHKEVKIPVPISLEEFRPNFRLYSTALVQCDEIYGGFISTEDDAELGIVNSDSHIWAGKKIKAEYVQNSSLEAPEVAITRTIIDAKIKTDRFIAQGERLFPVTNTEVDAISVFMNQVLIQGGDNVIDLGGSLIRHRSAEKILAGDLLDRITHLEEERSALLECIKNDLIQIIKKTTADRRGALIQFAKKMNAYPEAEVMRQLDRFKGYDNMTKIEVLKKNLVKLKALKISLDNKKARKRNYDHKDREAMKELQKVSYRITGFVAPGGILKIRCQDWETEYAADKGCHLGVNLAGKIGEDGAMCILDSSTRPVQNPLTYPQVQTKNAVGDL
ncbi:MAG: FapA family protein, partial [Desulfobacterales bacterium]|nr:FapA family protein [Desulfobacterales bacterium]